MQYLLRGFYDCDPKGSVGHYGWDPGPTLVPEPATTDRANSDGIPMAPDAERVTELLALVRGAPLGNPPTRQARQAYRDLIKAARVQPEVALTEFSERMSDDSAPNSLAAWVAAEVLLDGAFSKKLSEQASQLRLSIIAKNPVPLAVAGSLHLSASSLHKEFKRKKQKLRNQTVSASPSSRVDHPLLITSDGYLWDPEAADLAMQEGQPELAWSIIEIVAGLGGRLAEELVTRREVQEIASLPLRASTADAKRFRRAIRVVEKAANLTELARDKKAGALEEECRYRLQVIEFISASPAAVAALRKARKTLHSFRHNDNALLGSFWAEAVIALWSEEGRSTILDDADAQHTVSLLIHAAKRHEATIVEDAKAKLEEMVAQENGSQGMGALLNSILQGEAKIPGHLKAWAARILVRLGEANFSAELPPESDALGPVERMRQTAGKAYEWPLPRACASTFLESTVEQPGESIPGLTILLKRLRQEHTRRDIEEMRSGAVRFTNLAQAVRGMHTELADSLPFVPRTVWSPLASVAQRFDEGAGILKATSHERARVQDPVVARTKPREVQRNLADLFRALEFDPRQAPNDRARTHDDARAALTWSLRKDPLVAVASLGALESLPPEGVSAVMEVAMFENAPSLLEIVADAVARFEWCRQVWYETVPLVGPSLTEPMAAPTTLLGDTAAHLLTRVKQDYATLEAYQEAEATARLRVNLEGQLLSAAQEIENLFKPVAEGLNNLRSLFHGDNSRN